MISDPGRINLRKASRAAIVTAGLYALIVLGFDDDIVGLFAAFASFSALVFCDFGGALHARARAYFGVLVVGAALVALGTVVSEYTWAAAAVMAVVAFATVLVGALGGYFAASGITVILAYVLAAMVPGLDSTIVGREVGWVVGVAVAGVAALVLWPARERTVTRRAAADVADSLAAFVLDPTGETRASLDAASASLDASAGAVFRPAGAAARDRALVAVVRELRLAVQFSAQLRGTPDGADLALQRAVADELRAVAATLRVPSSTVDVSAIVIARAAHTEHLEGWVRDSMRERTSAAIIERFDAEFPGRALSLRVLALSANAATFSGAQLLGLDTAVDRAPADLTFLTAPTARVAFAHRLASHCNPSSVRFRAALRAAIGLAIAVAIGKAFDIQHGFWVVLGTLSVLRSNAFGTGVTAAQAVLGALIGFGVSSVVILGFGGNETLAWIALPVAIFLAAYTPGAIHFVVGQASFAVFVVLLFNIIQPEGWHTGLIRVEDIALGVSISIVIGAMLWPRGARAAAVDTFGVMLRDGAALMVASLRSLIDPEAHVDVDGPRNRAMASRDRAISALEDYTVERNGGHVDRDAWIALLSMSGTLLLASDGVARLSHDDPVVGCGDAGQELFTAATTLEGAIGHVADTIDPERGHVSDAVRTTLAPPADHGLAACINAHAHGDGVPPIALLWAREFVATVQQRVLSLESSDEPVDEQAGSR